MTRIDQFALRMKSYEASTTERKVARGKPLVARLDGNNFNKFTKDLDKPFDKRLAELMIATMQHLAITYKAHVGFCNSDEITLVWYYPEDSLAEYPFGGRVQKMESLLAATCSVFFNEHLFFARTCTPPVFDCRVFEVPNLGEAYHCLLWRQEDCYRNAVNSLACAHYSHKELFRKSTKDKIDILRDVGVTVGDLPRNVMYGTFICKRKVLKALSEDELLKIPEAIRPTKDSQRLRTEYQLEHIDLGELNCDPVAFLFYGMLKLTKPLEI